MKYYLIEDTKKVCNEEEIRKMLFEEEIGDITNNFKEYLNGELNIISQLECIKKSINGDMEQVVKMLNTSWNIPVKEITNNYTSILILKQNITIEELDTIAQYIKDHFSINKIDYLGLKELAYSVKDNKKGYYLVVDWVGTPIELTEIEEYFRQNEDILKFMTQKNN